MWPGGSVSGMGGGRGAAPVGRGRGSVPKGQIPCRNVLRFGYCKFQGRGCEYNHDFPRTDAGGGAGPGPVSEAMMRGRGPMMPPMDGFGGASYSRVVSDSSRTMGMGRPFHPGFPPVRPSFSADALSAMEGYHPFQPGQPGMPASQGIPFMDPTMDRSRESHIHPRMRGELPPSHSTSGTAPGHQLSGIPGHRIHRRTAADFDIAEEIKMMLDEKNRSRYAYHSDGDPLARIVPPKIGDRYHTVYALEWEKELVRSESGDALKPRPSSLLPMSSSCVKAIDAVSGEVVFLRRIIGVRSSVDVQLNRVVEVWKQLRHPSISTLLDGFLGNHFGTSLDAYFVHEFIPNAQTVLDVISAPGFSPFSEGSLWSILVQLTSTLRFIHERGLAARSLYPSKVLLTNDHQRVVLSGVGPLDVFLPAPQGKLLDLQKQDFIELGCVAATMLCGQAVSVENYGHILESVRPQVSDMLLDVFGRLIAGHFSNTMELFPFLGPHVFTEIDRLSGSLERHQDSMTRQVENGRLFRILAKLGFINERPEYLGDPKWSETGDRYIVKLFRDYLFHQTSPDGAPLLDIAHVVESLTKLDVGSPEKVLLMGHESQSVLIVSFADIRRCVESAFGELMKVQ